VRLLAVLGIVAVASAGAAGATGKAPRQAIEPALQAHAKKIAVRLGDLPGFGWKAHAPQTDRSSPRCSYYNPDRSKLTENGDYVSPDFIRSDGLYVSSSVGIYASAKQAKTAFALVVRPELPRCLGESIVKSDKPGHIKLHSTGTLAFRRYGDASVAYRIVFLVKNGGQQVPATIDLVAINEGAVDVVLFFSAAGQPVPPGLERTVTAAVTARI
jgi:hypothetical protein